MKVLIACEESQEVCKAFRKLGHEAYSCDTQDCSGGHPEWHIKADVLTQLNAGWDMMIAHPPCTYLSNAGANWLFRGKKLNEERYAKGLKAKEFFMRLLNADIPMIAVENPVPSSIYKLPRYSQIIQPYQFGEPYSKKTCLWLKGLPKLSQTKIITNNIIQWVNGGSKKADGTHRSKNARAATFRDSKTKSKTFKGIAQAMAEQWTKRKQKTVGEFHSTETHNNCYAVRDEPSPKVFPCEEKPIA